MTGDRPMGRIVNVAIIGIALGLALGALWVARPLLIPLALAILFAFILSPVVGGAERFVPRPVAVVGVVALTALGLGALVWIGLAELNGLAGELPRYRSQLNRRLAEIRGAMTGGAVEELEATVDDILKEPPPRAPAQPPVAVVEQPARPRLFTIATALRVGGAAAAVALVVTFILLDRQELRNRIIHIAGQRRLAVTTRAMDEASRRISRYLLTQAALNAGLGFAAGIALFLLGVPFALLWGALFAILRFIPFIGSWVAIGMPTAFSLATVADWTQPLLVFGVLVVLVVACSFGVEPFLHGRTAGASRVGLLGSMAFWTWLWGPVGLVIATPITVCLLVLGRHVPRLRLLAVVLGDAPVLPPPMRFYQRLLAGDHDEATAVLDETVPGESWIDRFDRVMLPALAAARADRLEGTISEQDERRVVDGARRILRETDVARGASAHPEDAPLVIGCAADDDTDALALTVLAAALDRSCHVEILSPELLSAEVVASVLDRAPAAVVIAAVPPGGIAAARYLIKRLRRDRRDLKILVGRWGVSADADNGREALASAGADAIGASLAETMSQLDPLLSLAVPSPQHSSAGA